jgi:hypothetical protein
MPMKGVKGQVLISRWARWIFGEEAETFFVLGALTLVESQEARPVAP